MLQGRGHCRDQRCPAIELSLSTALWPLTEALAQCDTLTTTMPSEGLEVEISFCHLSEAHPCLIIIFLQALLTSLAKPGWKHQPHRSLFSHLPYPPSLSRNLKAEGPA